MVKIFVEPNPRDLVESALTYPNNLEGRGEGHRKIVLTLTIRRVAATWK
jgi:hypothetical protein